MTGRNGCALPLHGCSWPATRRTVAEQPDTKHVRVPRAPPTDRPATSLSAPGRTSASSTPSSPVAILRSLPERQVAARLAGLAASSRRAMTQAIAGRFALSSRSSQAHLICSDGLAAFSHTVEKPAVFARCVTLGSSKIRFIVVIVRYRPELGRRPGWRVGKTQRRVRSDHALMGTSNSVPPVCVMHRSRICGATQGDQKAQGKDITHRFFSNHWPRQMN